MQEESTKFHSDGLKIDASFYLPDAGTGGEGLPMLLACSGFMGMKEIHPARFARAMTPRGYTCFGFDYRGFGASEGAKNGVALEEQVRDIVNAAVYAVSSPHYRNNGLILLGWGMGGGLILEAAKELPELRGVVCVNGFYSAERVQKELRGSVKYRDFMAWVRKEHVREVQTGSIQDVDPFDIYPLDDITREYVDNVLRKQPGFGGTVPFTFAHSLLRFCPEASLSGLAHLPLLIVHGDRNDLHPPTEAESLLEKYPGRKELHWLPDAGHTEWMLDDNPIFQGLIRHVDGWMRGRAAKGVP